MYHSIGTPVEDDVLGLYNMARETFASHMRFLAENYKERLVPLDHPMTQGSSLKIAVTFDDGFQDNLSVAAPILMKLGIPFTVFVRTGAVAQRKAGFLTEADVRELAGLPGAFVGSHSIEHQKLMECDDRSLKEELSGSKSYLENLLGRPITLLSYPHGSVDRRVSAAAAAAGYRVGGTSRFDVNAPARDPLLLCRSLISAHDDVAILEQKLRGDWDWYRWRSSDPAVRS